MPTNLWAENLTWQLLTSFCNYTLNPEKKFLNSNYLKSGFPGSSNYWTWFTKNFLPYQGRIKDLLKKYFLILSNKYHPSNHLILFILHYIYMYYKYLCFVYSAVGLLTRSFKLLRTQKIYAAKRYYVLSALAHSFQSYYFIFNFQVNAV